MIKCKNSQENVKRTCFACVRYFLIREALPRKTQDRLSFYPYSMEGAI